MKVMVRVRPFNSREIALTEGGTQNLRSIVLMEGPTVRLLDHERNYAEREAFEFDQAFWSIPESQNQFSTNPFADNETVFRETGLPAVENALAGYHNTIFAYGQTGSGKTHSMLGSASDEGIAPRLVRALFERINNNLRGNNYERIQYTVELSFLEIYNEKVKDLLAIAEKGKGRSNQGESGYAECRVRFHPERGTFVEGLTRIAIDSEAQCLTAIKDGMEHRAVTSTLMNDTSSRSHAIFQISLTQKMPLKGTSRISIINLVDLAGSERISMSGVVGAAMKEATSINLSLSTLRRVIDILIENSKIKKGQRPQIPPYRQSLLTWVLSDSLGGNSKTVMVAAISPFSGNVEDSLGTLRYALKAKAIVCNARVNEEKTQAVVNAMRAEMEELRKQLAEKADADQAEQDRIRNDLRETEENFEQMQKEAKRLEEEKITYEQELVEKTEKLAHAQSEMIQLENAEVEKKMKEAELIEARNAREEADALLERHALERQKREEELEELKTRKKMLEEHHNKAADEEARAKLAAEQARLRQFASAFQNAFILGKQRSGLDELKEERDRHIDSVKSLEIEKREKERLIAQLVSDKGMYKRKMDVSQKRAAEIYDEVRAVRAAREANISEVKQLRDEAEARLRKVQRELETKENELKRLQQENDVEHAEQDKESRILELELENAKLALKQLSERKQILNEESNSAQQDLVQLEKEYDESTNKLQRITKDNQEKANLIEQLRKKKERVVLRRTAASDQIHQHRVELEDLGVQLDSLNAEVDELRAAHSELRAFVSNKFFPVGQ